MQVRRLAAARAPSAAAVGRRALSTYGSEWFEQPVERRFTGSIKYDRYAVNRDRPEMRYRDVLPLWVADMDLRAPRCLSQAIAQRAEHGVFGYTGPDYRVKGAILEYLRDRHGVTDVEPEHLVFLPGLVVALNVVARMAARRGEGILTACPVYPPFHTSARNAGADCTMVPLTTCPDTGKWTLDFDAIEAAVRSAERRVGVFLLCNPHNPAGRAFTRRELERLGSICRDHQIDVVSDEIHCDLLLDPDVEHVPWLRLRGGSRGSITLHAPSKTFNVAGLCAAFAVVPDPELRASFKREARGIVADVNTFGYEVLEAAYGSHREECERYRLGLLDHLRGNLAALRAFLEALPPAHRGLLRFDHHHEATYLVWLDARGLQARLSGTAALWLEYEAGVGLNDGVLFGPQAMYKGWVRINLGCPRATLDAALARIAAALHRSPDLP